MRILHLDAGREMRGGQWQALRLIQGLAAEGVESTLLARPDAPLFEAARQLGCAVEPLGIARLALLAGRHDLVHAHDARCHTLAALASRVPLVVSRRVGFGGAGAEGASRPALPSRWKYTRPAHYIAVSEFVKSVLVERGVPAARVSVVYDSVPLLEQSQGSAVLAPANAADRSKGAPLALEAARLAGVELKLSTALEHDLSEAAIFVYITHSEGLGSGVLLAMSAGVAVIASRVGGLPEIVEQRQTGLLVENQPAAIAAAIGELQADRELARGLGRAARRRVMEEFTVDRMVRRTMEIYREIYRQVLL
jgi:hypothetical protein